MELTTLGACKYNIDYDFFQDSEEYWYFLGLLASDGYISNDRIELGLNIKDTHILEELRDLISPDKPLYSKTKTNSITFTINSRVIAKNIKQLFSMTTNKKSDEIRMPTVPSEYLKDFVRGVIDGDGCIDTTKGYRADKVYVGSRLRILGNKEFLADMIECIREQVPNKTYAVSRKGKEDVYYVTYNFSIADNILNWCYRGSNIHLDRKMQKYMTLAS